MALPNYKDLSTDILNYQLSKTLGQFVGSEHPELTGVTKEVIPVIVLNKEQLTLYQGFEIGIAFPAATVARFQICGLGNPLPGTPAEFNGQNYFTQLFNILDLSKFTVHRSRIPVYNSAGAAANIRMNLGCTLVAGNPAEGGGNNTDAGAATVDEWTLYETAMSIPAGGSDIVDFGGDGATFPVFPSDGYKINLTNVSNNIESYWIDVVSDTAGVAFEGTIAMDFIKKVSNQSNDRVEAITPT